MLSIDLPKKNEPLISEDGWVRLSMDKSFLNAGESCVAKSVHTFLAGVTTLKPGMPIAKLADKLVDSQLLTEISKLAGLRILDIRSYIDPKDKDYN